MCFYYHLYGEHQGTLKVLILDQDGTQLGMFEEKGDQGNTWKVGNITMQGNCRNCTLLFVGIKGNGYRSDVAIDAVSTNCSANNAGNSFDDSSYEILDV